MPKKEKTWLTTNRVETLADGVFAIAMTLLVLGLAVPDAPKTGADDALRDYLGEDWPKFFYFVESFLLLAVFWVTHHRISASIKRADEAYLWINILALMFIVLIPFTTTLNGEYGSIREASLLFDVNMLAVGICYFFLWLYASRGYRLISRDEYDSARIAIGRKRSMVVPLVSMLAMALTLVSPSWSSMAYVLIPLILMRLK